MSVALAIALVALAPKAFPSAPSRLKLYPGLNYVSADAWILPLPGTRGIGLYVSPKQNWSLAVERGSAGTDTSDDFCSRVRQVDTPLYERSFGILFLLDVRNTGSRAIGIRDSAFSLVEDDSSTFPGMWFGPTTLLPGDSLFVDPGRMDREYVYFGGLPRVEASYSLQLRLGNGSIVGVGRYQVIPNHRNPCLAEQGGKALNIAALHAQLEGPASNW